MRILGKLPSFFNLETSIEEYHQQVYTYKHSVDNHHLMMYLIGSELISDNEIPDGA